MNILPVLSKFRKPWLLTLAGTCLLQQSPAMAQAPVDPSKIPFSSAVPTDIADPRKPDQAAAFAWQEFIALGWPAKPNPTALAGESAYFRGQPSPDVVSGATGSGGFVVWQTFYHRVELFPFYSSQTGNKLPDPNAAPNYNYGQTIPKATKDTDLNLFTNLDEASEIALAFMYYTPLAAKVEALLAAKAPATEVADAGVKAGLLYEAKGNPAYFNYLKATGFNNRRDRKAALTQSINKISNLPVSAPAFELPNGTIEIKATWRHFDPTADHLDDFHWAKGVYYTSDTSGNLLAHNDILLLIGLHIIHKTPNVPTFTFATFEHVSNEKNGFRFTNTDPLSTPVGGIPGVTLPRTLPDGGIITASRQFPIPGADQPFNLVAFNSAVQTNLRGQFGKDLVWANYQLVGVQAVVADDPTDVVPAQQFFLSNFATETNDTLQFFQGGLGGSGVNVPNPTAKHVFQLDPITKKFIAHSSGGCLGCHGSQGQFAGGDFSVIAATGNLFQPEAVTPYPGGAVVPQNPKGFPLPHQ